MSNSLHINPPEGTRAFDDPLATRKLIFANTLTAARTLQPISNQKHTLTLQDVDYIDPPDVPLSTQKKAILSNGTLGRRMKGTWVLTDNATGQELDRKSLTVAKVPYLTQRGTFIHNGSHYGLKHQMRLLPGVYTRVKDNGEIESHGNVLPGDGQSHRYFLDPDKGTFHVTVGQAKIPLTPLMRALGATPQDLQEAWGDLYPANMKLDTPDGLNKAYLKFAKKPLPEATLEQKHAALQEAFTKMRIHARVAQATLGQPFENLSLPAVLATTKKLIAVSKGAQDVDDRDHLAYQMTLGPEDLLAERLNRDAGGARRRLFHRMSYRGNLQYMPPRALDDQLWAGLLGSGLGSALEETNLSELMDKQSQVTRMGAGGIGSSDAIPMEARSVQPSHFGFIDSLRTPESMRSGVDLNFAAGARKGPNGILYAPFKNAQTGQIEWKTPHEINEHPVATEDSLRLNWPRIPVMHGGRIRYVRKNEVTYVQPHFEHTFSHISNLIPMKSGIKGQRAVMGGRMLTQALPLVNPQAPLVQSGVPGSNGERSYEELYGRHMGAVHATQGGRVVAITPDEIKVKHDDGSSHSYELYNALPLNRKTMLHNTPRVNVGDRFEPGHLLAKSNYTDDAGTTALGLNARVAFMPHPSAGNYEDGIIISQSLADRLKSQHLYQHAVDWRDPNVQRGKTAFVSLFASKHPRKVLDTLDSDGVIKPGTPINFGHPLILVASKREHPQNKVHRKNEAGFTDNSVMWEHHSPGIVKDVVKTPHGPVVTVYTERPMIEADKLTQRFGGKGVIGKIIPDEQMPHDLNGNPMEVLMNPFGTISRANPTAIVEAQLGKAAAARGKPYKVEDFEKIEDLAAYAHQELKRHGITPTETLIDPITGRKIKNVATGMQWYMKLHHMAEDKSQGRGTAGAYGASGEPAKGSGDASKRLAMMDTNAILSHGALSILRDARLTRGTRNEDFWLAFMQGHTPPEPRVPFVYDKFVNELQGSGIHVVPTGTGLRVQALTRGDVKQLASDRHLTVGDTVDWDSGLSPVEGGLFDPKLTGGHGGRRWSSIKLHEPMPSPVMEDPIRKLLGLTQNKFEAVVAGKEKLGDLTGPEAIGHALDKMNIPREIAAARMQMTASSKTKRDDAVRRLGYLKSIAKSGIHPREWMLDAAPVLPPAFRPVALMGNNNTPLISDPNYLYKELFEANKQLRQLKPTLGVEGTQDERLGVYKALKAVMGWGDPLQPELQQKGVRGIIKKVLGSSSKYGVLQRRLLSTPVDTVGRAVIQPDADLDMDSVGLPEDKAWNVYRNFVVRRLVRKGLSMSDALRQSQDRTPAAKAELLAELKERPVLINRAPVLHKLGFMAAWPRLAQGDALRISPLVTSGFGADFDGDQMNYHVPVSSDAVSEAIEKLMPSRNLISAADFKTPTAVPRQEAHAGLFELTRSDKKGRKVVFRNEHDVLAAYRRGDLSPYDEVEIME